MARRSDTVVMAEEVHGLAMRLIQLNGATMRNDSVVAAYNQVAATAILATEVRRLRRRGNGTTDVSDSRD